MASSARTYPKQVDKTGASNEIAHMDRIVGVGVSVCYRTRGHGAVEP
jgi:hypothetical protein